MLDHANICWTIESLRAGARRSRSTGSRIVSYLPMAHIAERITTHYGGIAFGYEVTTCPDIRLLGALLARDATADPLRCAAHVREDPQRGAGRARRRSRPSAEVFDAGARGRRARSREHRARGEALSVRARRRVRARSTPRSLRPVRQLLGLDALRVAVTAARADPRRGPPVLPRARACRSRRCTACRSRRAR